MPLGKIRLLWKKPNWIEFLSEENIAEVVAVEVEALEAGKRVSACEHTQRRAVLRLEALEASPVRDARLAPRRRRKTSPRVGVAPRRPKRQGPRLRRPVVS